MKNGFKDNPLACGLLGFIIGSGSMFGVQKVESMVGTSGVAVSAVNRVDTVYIQEGSDQTKTPQVSSLMSNTDAVQQEEHTETPVVTKEKPTNFDKIPYDANGDVVITENGKKYHREGCHTLSQSKKVRRVNSSDAENGGLSACSRCLK